MLARKLNTLSQSSKAATAHLVEGCATTTSFTSFST
jgi:hypothetical protein